MWAWEAFKRQFVDIFLIMPPLCSANEHCLKTRHSPPKKKKKRSVNADLSEYAFPSEKAGEVPHLRDILETVSGTFLTLFAVVSLSGTIPNTDGPPSLPPPRASLRSLS